MTDKDQPLATERAQILEEIYDYVVSMTIRVELLGGQRTTYIQRATLLDWLEAEMEKGLAAPVSPEAAKEPRGWYCSCGHPNGINLAACAVCDRRPGGPENPIEVFYAN